MQMISVIGVAHRKHEFGTFHLVREKGQQAFNFVHFIMPAIVIIDGIEHITDNNACIIYTPRQPQEYKIHNGIFLNDFITFHTNNPDFLAKYKLPINEIFYINNSHEVTYILECIAWAAADKTVSHEDDISEGVERLFTTLSDSYMDYKAGLKRMSHTKQRFIELRGKIRNDPKEWTIDMMAERVWLTRSRFSVLYKNFFNISPNADLMNIKIELAKKLLKTADVPVAEISNTCGYTSVGYFIRLFGKQTGQTPLQYRKSQRK